MSGRALESEALDRGDRVAVTTVVVQVYDRGPEPAWHEDRRLYGPWWRYEAELASYPLARELGSSPWEAVRRLVANHRVLLERRWSA